MGTFNMLESTKIDMKEEEEEQEPKLSIKELEELKKLEKEKQSKKDDVALLVAMIVIIAITVGVVAFKLLVIDEPVDPNISTFTPLLQAINSNIKYNGNGYTPCNGYVPCQPLHLSPKQREDRIKDAPPCHDYLGNGGGPDGCW